MEKLTPLKGMLTIDDHQLKFEFAGLIYVSLEGDQLAKYLERRDDGNIIITLNHR